MVLLLAIPLALIGILVFAAFAVVILLIGWVYLGFRIGFGELWDVTKLAFGVGLGPPSSLSRTERIRRAWEERVKGRSGIWTK